MSTEKEADRDYDKVGRYGVREADKQRTVSFQR